MKVKATGVYTVSSLAVVYAGSKCCLSLDMCTGFAKPCEYRSTCGDGKCHVDAHGIHKCHDDDDDVSETNKHPYYYYYPRLKVLDDRKCVPSLQILGNMFFV